MNKQFFLLSSNVSPIQMMFLPSREIDLPVGFHSPEEYLQSLVAFVKRYKWLYELHMVDFLTHRHWDLLDPSWQEALLPDQTDDGWLDIILQLPSFEYKMVRPVDLASLRKIWSLTGQGKKNKNLEWPESLKKFIRETHALQLPRYPSSSSSSSFFDC